MIRTAPIRAILCAAIATGLVLLGGLLLSRDSTAGSSSSRSAASAQPQPGPRAASSQSSKVPHIEHYFILVLENENAASTFGADSKAPYLAQTLKAKGAYIPNYYATGHLSLDNYISMISGQGPNPVTQADCPSFTEFSPAGPAADGQFLGQGCVYPAQVKTVANQLEDKGLTWKSYNEDLAGPGSQPAPSCRHPAIGAQDTTQSAEKDDQYATRHNPFVYFHSLIDTPSCALNDLDLNRLPADLKSAASSASYSFITPDLCSDGHDEPCIDGRPGGLVSADAFLGEWVPKILASPAYRDHGMLLITFDEAEAQGSQGDSSGCCGEVQGPNTPNNGALVPGVGGGKIGAVSLSPCTRPGTVTETPYNHYSQLRFVEQNFGLSFLGYARPENLQTFGSDILNFPTCGQRAKIRSVAPRVARRAKQTKFKIRVKAEFPDCRAGVTVRMGKKKARTNANGVARIKRSYGGAGRKKVRANKPGCAPSTFKIRVKR